MIRVGQGIDVHRFSEERPLVLGGVTISEQGGLAGHSDADAVLHALTDALLGAIGAGDIGEHFPSSDERWRNAPSSRFIERACNLIFARKGHVVSVDVTIVAERPKLSPYRQAMRSSIAELLGIPVDRVSVKATTTDGLGFIGRGEGIFALALAVVEV